ncbi:unnamed protein product [Arctogadus glacialis]
MVTIYFSVRRAEAAGGVYTCPSPNIRSRRSGRSLHKGAGLQRRGAGPLLAEGWLRLRRGPLHSGWEQQLMQTECRRPVQNCCQKLELFFSYLGT